MAQAPKRPIRYLFKLGRGNVKGRRESANPMQAAVEQLTVQYAERTWEQAKRELGDRIEQDVRGELTHVAGEFRRHVIGAPGAQRGLVGALTTVTKGAGQPHRTLGGLPRWAPRTARYLEDKKSFTGHQNWFDNTGWEPNGGTLKEYFGSEKVGNLNIGSGGVFERIFGPISVEVRRNNTAWGVNRGNMRIGPDGHAEVQLATVRVRALGQLTENMMNISDRPNTELLDLIGRDNATVALHLRGGRGRYRPTMEPYLRFFLEQAMPFAVSKRIERGTTTGGLLRRS